MKTIFLAITLMLLTSCSSLNPLDVLTDKPSLEVNAQIAKNAEQDKSVIKVESGKTEQKADIISNDTQFKAESITQVTEQMPAWMFFVVIGLAGLAIDGKGFLVTVREDVKGLLKFPFNFILTLFGKEKI